MKKCCFIIPYFGKFPNYFQLFLNSCQCNPDFQWLLFTDDHDMYTYPLNVKVVYMSYEDFRKNIQMHFDFPIVIPTVHKLCDFKPAYGYLFEEYIKDFMFWGYCDLDLILGNLSRFLTDEILRCYDKIFCLGHMTLYRNTYENNRIFMHEYKGLELYKIAFSSKDTITFDEEWRDEYNVNRIFLLENKKVFCEDFSMNVSIFHDKFVRIRYVGFDVLNDGHGYVEESPKKALYVWDKGNVFRYYIENKELVREDFIYIHLQARKMKVNKRTFELSSFKIMPNKFAPLEVSEVNLDNFHKIKKCDVCIYAKRKYWKKLKNRLKKYLHYD